MCSQVYFNTKTGSSQFVKPRGGCPSLQAHTEMETSKNRRRETEREGSGRKEGRDREEEKARVSERPREGSFHVLISAHAPHTHTPHTRWCTRLHTAHTRWCTNPLTTRAQAAGHKHIPTRDLFHSPSYSLPRALSLPIPLHIFGSLASRTRTLGRECRTKKRRGLPPGLVSQRRRGRCE